MAKPVTVQALPRIGFYFAHGGQPTYQAPRTNSSIVDNAGTLAGYVYSVFHVSKISNATWALLENATAGKFEWVRVGIDGELPNGEYVALG